MSRIANGRHQLRLLLFAVLASSVASELFAEPPPTNSPAVEQIEQWAAQLDDDRFDIRQRAQQQLEQAGEPALTAVAEVAKSGSLESSTRAINILLQWTEAKAHGLRLASLEKLSILTNRPRESSMAKRLLAEVRAQAALDALIALGAKGITHSVNNVQVILGPQWKGGYEGLKHLADIPHASWISLHDAPLSDPVLAHIAALPGVQRVEIYGTEISPAAIEKFKKQAPSVVVDVRVGAYLGVGSRNVQGSITEVKPNSAAEKAGIKLGDRITEFDGEKVVDFKELTDKIRKHKPGDTVTLTLLRNNQPRKVKVTFGDWGKSDTTPSKPPLNQFRIQNPNILPPKIQVNRR